MQLKGFQVFKFRNIIDSGWVDVSSVSTFVGQNECGKSNLLQALFMLNPYDEEEQYRINSDWPIDMWPPGDPSEVVCKAQFTLSDDEIRDFIEEAQLVEEAEPETETDTDAGKEQNNDVECSAQDYHLTFYQIIHPTIRLKPGEFPTLWS